MRVIELRAKNFQGLKAVEITPNEHMVIVSGRNGAGKTSVLNALWAILAGGTASKHIPAPVRQGSGRAEGTVDLGDLRVTRTWQEGGSTAGSLKVVAADGARLSSPQDVLNRLMGSLTFDPLAFSRMGERDQVVALLDVVRLPFDPAALAAERRAIFDRRTDVNREVDRLKGELANKPTPPDGLPDREVSIAELTDRHTEAMRLHQQQQHAARDADTAAGRVQQTLQQISQIEAEIARLQAALTSARQELTARTAAAEEARTSASRLAAGLPDVEAIASQLRDADAVNRQIRLRDERTTLAEMADEQQRAADALTSQIEALDDRRRRALATVDMPLPGLSFDDDRGVTLHGVPLKACSGAEQLRTSIAIAMAANPTLRVIRITDGSLLDDDGMRLIADMASDRDYQLWVEVVDSSGEVGIVIEDGEVYANNEPVGAGATR